jgi:hypothetical protein
MPNRLQWLARPPNADYALIGACIVAFLLAALIWFLWIATDLAMYFGTAANKKRALCARHCGLPPLSVALDKP